MRCPLCNVPMREVDRRGVRIDVCPECRGVWLDAGELEKLLTGAERWEADDFERRDREPDPFPHPHPYRRKHRRHFLDELFDFDFFD
ncbi:MAG: zf-TFIIB domain-containing protein [Clostridia bacterium]|nr:zf-TFIIB domain-containing protein [Clostridia bacterium]